MGLRLYTYDQRFVLKLLWYESSLKTGLTFWILHGLSICSQGRKLIFIEWTNTYSSSNLKKQNLHKIPVRLLYKYLKLNESMDSYQNPTYNMSKSHWYFW